jgi:hypothetical protein
MSKMKIEELKEINRQIAVFHEQKDAVMVDVLRTRRNKILSGKPLY